MKTFTLACAAALLTVGGCSAQRAAEACAYLKSTPQYGQCYAQVYEAERARHAAAGAAMLGSGTALMTTPYYSRSQTTNCFVNRYTGQVSCTTF